MGRVVSMFASNYIGGIKMGKGNDKKKLIYKSKEELEECTYDPSIERTS